MLIKKNEEPFFHRFLSIAKEIIKKNSAYPPVFYGDDEKLYLVCNNYAAVYDQIEANGGQTTIAMTIYFNIKDDPKNNAYDQQEMEFVQQPAEYDSFENMDVEEPEETYHEEQELDSLMNETIIEETRGVEDEFDPMRA